MNNPITSCASIQLEEEQYSQESTDAVPKTAHQESELADVQSSDADSISTLNMVVQPTHTYTFQPYSYEDILTMPPKEWWINKIFGPGDIGIVYGAPGSGKTFVIIDMILCMCLGRQWAKRFDIKKQLNVAYCAGEGLGGLPSRIKACAKHYEAQSIPNLTFFKMVPLLFDPGNRRGITDDTKTFVNDYKMRSLQFGTALPDVVIYDTFASTIPGANENDSGDMGVAMMNVKYIRDELGCVVILVHHTNKGGTSERGSNAPRGAADFMIEIGSQNAKAGNTMKCDKLKDEEAWSDAGFKLEKSIDGIGAHIVWTSPDEGYKDLKTLKEEIMYFLTKNQGRRYTVREICEFINKDEGQTRDSLNELTKSSKCKKDDSRYPKLYYV